MPDEKRPRPSQKRWVAKQRQNAAFEVVGLSSAFPGENMEWRVVIGSTGYVATRKSDGRRVSITWKEAIGLAMFEGRDSARGQEAKL